MVNPWATYSRPSSQAPRCGGSPRRGTHQHQDLSRFERHTYALAFLPGRDAQGVGVFIEGFDCPPIETVILARAFGVAGSYLQAIGRGLRPSPATGKTRCTVLDLRGAVNLHGLPDEERRWSLDGKAVVRTEPLKALRRCAEGLAIFRPTPTCPRCGAKAVAAPKVPRTLNRAEKLESFSAVSQPERDASFGPSRPIACACRSGEQISGLEPNS